MAVSARARGGLGGLAPLQSATGWASGASGISGDPVAAATGAVLLGALVGAAAGTAVLGWRGVGRSAAVWVGWVWLNVTATVASYKQHRPGRGDVVSADPFGMFTPAWRGHDDLVQLAVLSSLLPAALLGWWAGRRGDRAPLAGVVVGPAVVVAVHLVVQPLSSFLGDHYSLQSDAAAWLLVAVLGLGAGAVGFLAGRVRPASAGDAPVGATRDADPLPAGAGRRPAAVVVALLTVAASLLVSAVLIAMSWGRGGWLDAGAAGLAFGAALAYHRGRELSRIAGVGSTLAGIAGLAIISGVFQASENLSALSPPMAPLLVIMGLVGALVRKVDYVAWSVAAVGGLHVIAPVAGGFGFMVEAGGYGSGYLLITALLGLLAAATATAVLSITRKCRQVGAVFGQRGQGSDSHSPTA